MKKRLLYYKLLTRLEHKNALVIVGMRQVGKTTVMHQLFDYVQGNKVWFDFDNPLDQKLFEDLDYNNIYKRLLGMVETPDAPKMTVFIDEIQNFPEITKIIKYLIDYYNVKFIVTGSSSYYLKNLFPESLSGRKFLFELAPLNFREYLYFQDLLSLETVLQDSLEKNLQALDEVLYYQYSQHYADFLAFGGFPEVVTTVGNDLKGDILKNIVKSFFEKDIKFLSDYKDVKELRDLLLLLVPRIGSLLEINKLSQELGVSRPKIYAYLEFLQGTFMVRLLPKYSKSIDKSVAGGKKVYFTDTGILKTLGNVNDAQLFENSVINQLAYYGDLSFYNKRNTAEIDAILNKQIPFEVKLTGTSYDVAYLTKIARSLELKPGFIISRNFIQQDRILMGCGL